MSAEDDARLLIAQARDMGVGHQTGTVEVYRSWMTRVADVIEALLEPGDLVQGDAKLRENSGDADATENHENGRSER